MANSWAVTLGEFEANIHNTKDRLIAIPRSLQLLLGLERRKHNHLIKVSLRKVGSAYWNHHYFRLTCDNEFAIPTDITGLQQGDRVQIKVHAVIEEKTAEPEPHESGAALLLRLVEELDRKGVEGWRTDGAERHDYYLREDIIASGRA